MKVNYVYITNKNSRSHIEFYDNQIYLYKDFLKDCEVTFDKEKIIITGTEYVYHDLRDWSDMEFYVTDELREKYELDESKMKEELKYFFFKRPEPTGKIISKQSYCKRKKTQKKTLYISNYYIEDMRNHEN